jgi:hypothetical protein
MPFRDSSSLLKADLSPPRLVHLLREARVRLLDEHVLPGREGAHRPLVVERVRQRDVDRVDSVVGEQLLVRAVRALDPVLARVRLRPCSIA